MLGNGHPNILQTQCIISLDNRDNFGLVIMELCGKSVIYIYILFKLSFCSDTSKCNNKVSLSLDELTGQNSPSL